MIYAGRLLPQAGGQELHTTYNQRQHNELQNPSHAHRESEMKSLYMRQKYRRVQRNPRRDGRTSPAVRRQRIPASQFVP
jgi:hypothetical protein